MKLLSIPDTKVTTPVVRRPRRVEDPDALQMDRQAYYDLEIFEADHDAPGLFDLLNRTRTNGGEKALRARWKKPWSSPERILSVQASLRYVIEKRAVFDLLPSELIVYSVEQHLHSGLPILEGRHALDLFFEILELRFQEAKNYRRTVTGVERTGRFVNALRRLTARSEVQDVPGELRSMLQEMRELVALPALAGLPREGEGELSWWRTMRTDRIIRQDERPAIERLLRLVFEIDALVSMADAVRDHGLVMPVIVPGPIAITAEGVYHPFVQTAVPNPLHVDQQHRLVFLTGPNMAGKTTYLRACGIALYLAHLGMGVPARTFRFSPCDALFTAIALADSVREGVSFFRAEALRVKTIAQAIADGRRVIALLDEPFMGTNVKDALDASRLVLTRLATKSGSVFLVSSHLIELGESLVATGSVDCWRFEASEQGSRLEFDYILRPGISAQRLGFRVLKEEGVFTLLEQTPGEG
jgi:DNA mismatch repair protein MutS